MKCPKVFCFNETSTFFIYIFINVIILHLTNAQNVLDRILTNKSAKSYLYLIIKLPKMVKTVIFLSLCVLNVRLLCTSWSNIFIFDILSSELTTSKLKILLVQAYATQHNSDKTCLFETF